MNTIDIENAILAQLYIDCLMPSMSVDLDEVRAGGGWDQDLFQGAVNRLARMGLIRRQLLEEKYVLSSIGAFYASQIAPRAYTCLRVSWRNG
jgi:hypothetical protein